MPPITIPTIDSLPEPPTKADPVNFSARADTFLGALPDFADTTNAAITEMNKIGAGLDQQTPIAAYDDETTYNFPTVAAGSDGYSYRCLGTNVLGDDPVGSATGNWVMLNDGRPGPLPTGVRLTGGIIGLGFTKTVEASVTVHPGVCFDSTGTIRLALAAEQVVSTPAGSGYDLYLCADGVVRVEDAALGLGGSSITQVKRWLGTSFNKLDSDRLHYGWRPHYLKGDELHFTYFFTPPENLKTSQVGFDYFFPHTPPEKVKNYTLGFSTQDTPAEVSVFRDYAGSLREVFIKHIPDSSTNKIMYGVQVLPEDVLQANAILTTYILSVTFNR